MTYTAIFKDDMGYGSLTLKADDEQDFVKSVYELYPDATIIHLIRTYIRRTL